MEPACNSAHGVYPMRFSMRWVGLYLLHLLAATPGVLLATSILLNVIGGSGSASGCSRSDVGWTFHRRRDIDGSLGGSKDLQAKEGKPRPPPDDPGNPTVDFHSEQRSNDTHESKTDPEAQLACKGSGKESKLSYSGNLLVENRNGLEQISGCTCQTKLTARYGRWCDNPV